MKAFMFLLAATVVASSVDAAVFGVGQEVDAIQGGKYYHAKIEKTGKCMKVSYDDGSSGMQVLDLIGPKGQGQSGAGKARGIVGEAVDVRWMDGAWYSAKITGNTACFQISYEGWTKENNEWVDAGRLFPKGSKAKGDTSQAGEKAKANQAYEEQVAAIKKTQPKPGTYGPKGDYTSSSGVYFSGEQVTKCRAIGANEYNCRRTGYNCTFDAGKGVCGILE